MTWKELKEQKDIIDRFREFRKFPERVSYEERLILLKFMYGLTGEGFEKYIADYFKEIEGVDVSKVTGGFNDGCIDVKCKKGNELMGIQCKNRSKRHIKEGDILYFLKKTEKIKKKLGEALSLYYITTNWLNQDAWSLVNQNGIHVKYYKDIITMNKKMNIDSFIKKNKNDSELVSGIDITNVLNKFYYRKGFGGKSWGDITYFYVKHIIPIFSKYELDFDKAEKESDKDDLMFLS